MAEEVMDDFLPCGSILATSGYRYFSLQCIYCDLQHGNWSLFIKHLREAHHERKAYLLSHPVEEQDLEYEANCSDNDQKKSYSELCEENIIEEEDFEELAETNVNVMHFSAQNTDTEEKETSSHLPDESVFVNYFEDVESKEASLVDKNENLNDDHAEVKNPAVYLQDVQEDSNDEKNIDVENSFSDLDESNYDFNGIDSSDSDDNGTDIEDADQEKQYNTNKISFTFKVFNRSTCDFIDCYKSHPCLWDPNHADFKNTRPRRRALRDIKNHFLEKYQVRLPSQRITLTIMRLQSFYKTFSFTQDKVFDKRQSYFERCSFLAGIELNDRIQIKNISAEKIIFGHIDDFTMGFIHICKDYPLLWDNNHRDYNVANARKEAYNEIFKKLKESYDVHFSIEEVCDAITRLQQYYHRVLTKERTNQPLTKSDLIYLDRCKFLPTRQNKIKCSECERSFRYDFSLQAHLLQAHGIGELPYKCDFCDQRFATRSSVKVHEVRSHTKNFDYICQYCQKGFAAKNEMQDHELTHMKPTNMCPHCGKSFRLKYQMSEHIRIVHERKRIFKCTLCPKDYVLKRQLDDHMRAHFNVRDKICKTCGKTFTNHQSLYRHNQLHSEIKRYECKLCSERFHQLIGLNRHMKKHHTTKSP